MFAGCRDLCRGRVEPKRLALSLFVMAGDTLLRPLVQHIKCLPNETLTTEARYRVHIVTEHHDVSALRDTLDEARGKIGYPILEIQTQIELVPVLVPSSADPIVLVAVVAQLEKAPPVQRSTWSVSTTS
jgi:putative Mg2+ transporter-C (MgtC) family protein